MTAVEFIEKKLFCDEYWFEKLTFEQIILQAKEMERKQIIDAWNNRNQDVIKSDGKSAKQYYNENYESIVNKHIEDNLEEINTFYQKEISNDEIEKSSYDFWEFKEFTQRACWKMGASWYREQIKNK
jgi:hypothetical protein